MMILLKTISGEMNTEARVYRNDTTGKYHAILRDMDAAENVGVVICPNYETAVVKARGFVGA